MSRLTKSQENYLKTIFLLSGNDGSVRITDIATRFGVSKASASIAVAKLEEKGFVQRDESRRVILTAKGLREAKRVADYYNVISDFLTGKLNVDLSTALIDARALEHVVSEETINAMRTALN